MKVHAFDVNEVTFNLLIENECSIDYVYAKVFSAFENSPSPTNCVCRPKHLHNNFINFASSKHLKTLNTHNNSIIFAYLRCVRRLFFQFDVAHILHCRLNKKKTKTKITRTHILIM